MQKNPVVLARLRNHFYRDSFRRLMLLLMISIGLNILLGLCASWLFLNQPEPEYFATSPDGKLIAMIPLQEPYATNREITAYASQAALSSTSLDYLNYKKDLRAAKRFYTKSGFNGYLNDLTSSGRLKELQDNGYVTKSSVNALPAICAQGVDSKNDRRYTWIVEVPLQVKYVGLQKVPDRYMVAKFKVVRVSTAETAQGVKVASVDVFQRPANYELCKGVVKPQANA